MITKLCKGESDRGVCPLRNYCLLYLTHGPEDQEYIDPPFTDNSCEKFYPVPED